MKTPRRSVNEEALLSGELRGHGGANTIFFAFHKPNQNNPYFSTLIKITRCLNWCRKIFNKNKKIYQKVCLIQKIILIVFIVLITNSVIAQEFNPPVKEFHGYIHDVFNDNIYIKIFSKEKNIDLEFKYDSLNSNIYFMDTSIVLVFYGAYYPSELKKLYHNIVWYNFYRTIPIFNVHKNEVLKNTDDSTTYHHFRTKHKVRFTGYDYEEYKYVEKKYGSLNSFGVFGGKPIEPYMIKSKNKFYIVNYFYKKRLLFPCIIHK